MKVILPYDGAEFGGVIRVEPHARVYYVWIEDGNKMFEVRFPGCPPKMITFGDFMDKARIQAPHTYELTFDLDALDYSTHSRPSTDINMEYAIFTLEPRPAGTAIININGSTTSFDSQGTAMILLPYGTTPFTVMAEGYAQYSGQVTVQKGTQANVPVNLVYTQSTLNITCATAGTTISVQGQQKSTTGTWSGQLPAGSYKIEVGKEAYLPVTEVVTLTSGQSKTLNIPALTPITVSLPVNVSPKGATIKVDGQEVGLTPYVIRDLLIGTHKIEITKEGYQPLTQTLTLAEGTAPAPLTGELAAGTTDYESLTAAQLLPLAEAGDAEAQFRLGEVYYYGLRRVTKNYVEAVKWYRKVAEQGYTSAQDALRGLGY